MLFDFLDVGDVSSSIDHCYRDAFFAESEKKDEKEKHKRRKRKQKGVDKEKKEK